MQTKNSDIVIVDGMPCIRLDYYPPLKLTIIDFTSLQQSKKICMDDILNELKKLFKVKFKNGF